MQLNDVGVRRLEAGQSEQVRRDRILDAAERAFAAHGFRGARIQNVADEAGMSPGNLYRYYTSKDEIVSAMVERDQHALASDFSRLRAAPDLLEGVRDMLCFHLVEASASRVQMILEIWAEAARSPTVAKLCCELDRRVTNDVAELVEARADGEIDGSYVARLMSTLCAGLLKRRATDPVFDAVREISMAVDVFRAALSGSIAPDGRSSS